jgi:purine-binding chemotaxis protein CheW
MTDQPSDAGISLAQGTAKARSLSGIKNVCAFWLGRRCFGVDIRIVSEVVTIESVLPVPISPPELLGLFNLRGTPVALIDLARVLDLPPAERPDAAATRSRGAFVLRSSAMSAALLIDRMEIVLPVSPEFLTSADAADEHPAVLGFFEAGSRGGLMITVLDADGLLERFDKLKFRT